MRPAALVVLILPALACASAPRAAHDGDLAAVREHLASGAQPDARSDEGGCDACTLLHQAADGGQVEVARLLLDRGADPNARAGHARTPLHYAAGGQSAEVTRLLLERGAAPSVEARDEWGNTPLLSAAGTVRTQDRTVYTGAGAMVTTARADEPSGEIIEALLAAGAKVGTASARGNAPLHIAAYKGYVGTVRLLLARGADPAARNAAGETAEALAARFGKQEVVEVLRQAR